MTETRVCAYLYCQETFIPRKVWQRFHHPDCKAAARRVHAHWSPHKCSLCGTMHEPDERTVLDVLEGIIEASDLSKVTGAIQSLILNRRAILGGRPGPDVSSTSEDAERTITAPPFAPGSPGRTFKAIATHLHFLN